MKRIPYFFFSLILCGGILLNFGCSDPEPPNLCADVQCENGGICVDGKCDCPENTEGSRCQVKIPVALTIHLVEYTDPSRGFVCVPDDRVSEYYVEVAQGGLRATSSTVGYSFDTQKLFYFTVPPTFNYEEMIVLRYYLRCPGKADWEYATWEFDPDRIYDENNVASFSSHLYSNNRFAISGAWVFD